MGKIYNFKQAMEILDISERTLYRRMDAGEIDAYREGQFWRFTEEAIADYRRLCREKTSILKNRSMKKSA